MGDVAGVGLVSKGHARARGLPEAVVEGALLAALEASAGAAFVYAANGVVYRANRASLASCAGDAKALLEALGDAGPWPRVVTLPARAMTYGVYPVSGKGTPAYYLAVERPCALAFEGRVSTALARWRLSRRQAQTLRLLAQGLSNKRIGERLGIALGTVEIHVSKVLRQAGCDSRSALVARFWGETG